VRIGRVCWASCASVCGEVRGKEREGGWKLYVWARIYVVCVEGLLGVVVVEGLRGSETESGLAGRWMYRLGTASMLSVGGRAGKVAMNSLADAVPCVCLTRIDLEKPLGY
jgi:hypothetical protein